MTIEEFVKLRFKIVNDKLEEIKNVSDKWRLDFDDGCKNGFDYGHDTALEKLDCIIKELRSLFYGKFLWSK